MQVFVTTHHKYASDSSVGQWMNLSTYDNKWEFDEACRSLHSDEPDPEFLFSDSEDIPAPLITESFISEDCWDILDNYSDQLEEVTVFIDWWGSWDASAFDDRYVGQYDSVEDYAEEYIEQSGWLDHLPSNLRGYFDYEKFARDLQLSGDIYHDDDTGHTFYA